MRAATLISSFAFGVFGLVACGSETTGQPSAPESLYIEGTLESFRYLNIDRIHYPVLHWGDYAVYTVKSENKEYEFIHFCDHPIDPQHYFENPDRRSLVSVTLEANYEIPEFLPDEVTLPKYAVQDNCFLRERII